MRICSIVVQISDNVGSELLSFVVEQQPPVFVVLEAASFARYGHTRPVLLFFLAEVVSEGFAEVRV